jgi:hypothetical protein
MTTTSRKQDFGMMIRVLLAYAAWLAMVFGATSGFVSVFIVVAAPLFFGSVIWHLRRTYSSSMVNRLAFFGAIAFFPFLAIQMFVMSRY